jgi:N-sulfoglucosamine sulfohydrolase
MKTLPIVVFAILVVCSHGWAAPPSHAAAGSKPNVVIVLADDLGWWSTGTYGDPNLKTPNLDMLAAQGMKFDYAFANCPVCTPCRCALGTGVYAIRSHIRSNSTLPKKDAPGLKGIAEHLTALGYRIGLCGKTDTGPFEQTAKTKCSVNPERFIKAKSDQPFFLVYGSTYPHVPWKKPVRLSPEKIIVPQMLIDDAETRQALCAYYADAGHFDEEVGQCMHWVEEAGLEGNTVFIATGEQGTPFPRGKWTCCDDGLRTLFVIRWPGKIKAGSQTKALIQYIDVAPTLVEIAGGDPAACDTGLAGAVGGGRGFDGRSFLDVLLGQRTEHDAYVYGTYNNVSAIRSVRDSHFLYIANVRQAPLELIPWAQNVNPYGLWKAWHRDAASNPLAATMLSMCKNPPPEELYDVIQDPHQLNNLVNDPQYHEQLELLKKQLGVWRKQYGDEKPLPPPSTKAAPTTAAKHRS